MHRNDILSSPHPLRPRSVPVTGASPMTLQETFDHIVSSLIKQGKPSYRDGDGCLYRCAAGHIIPDELYDPGMESLSISYVIAEFNIFPDSLLDKLQLAHDFNYRTSPAEWLASFRARARDVATSFNLSTKVLDS